jgi:hypothetical protein
VGGNIARFGRFGRFMDNAGGLCKHGGMGGTVERESLGAMVW